MKKAFIRTPVNYTRISSKFTTGRYHPVLHRIRAHKGVDYAAPIGTPIKATGNGVVKDVGWKSGYGNTVVIQHGQKYTTLYGHLNSFAKNMYTGKKINQGQTIGYVGMTGLATGPHLHYEFHINGVHVDPLSVKLPTADPLSNSELNEFKTQSSPLIAALNRKKSSMIAQSGDI